MNHLVAVTALVGFIVSLVVHVSAILGVDASARIPFVWLLHLGVFVVCIPLVLSIQKVFGPRPTIAQVRAAFPGWVVALGVAVLAYVVVNFLLFVVAADAGSPSIRDGKFVLEDHGRFVRELTSIEYTAFKAKEVRGVSGHWLYFYYMAFAYFMFRRQPNPSTERGGAAAHVKR